MNELVAVEEPVKHGIAKNIILWLLQVIGAVAFCLQGVQKIVGADEMIQLFATVGLGQWFRYFTGALEVMGAIMLLFPSTASGGALLLALVMGGATFAHLTVLHTSPALPVTLLVMMAMVAFGRHNRHKRKAHTPVHSLHSVH